MNDGKDDTPVVEVDELTPNESKALFDRAAKKTVGIPGEEFIARYRAGFYDNVPHDSREHCDIAGLVILLPFGEVDDNQ